MGFALRREAGVEITASSRKLDQQLRKAEKRMQRFGGQVRTSIGGGMRDAFGGGKGLLAIGSIGGLAAAARDVLGFEKQLTRLGIQAGRTPQEMDALRDSIRGISDDTGVSADELLAGAAKFVSLTGDIDGATQAVSVFARAASASGSSVEDIAATAASMRDNLNIRPEDFEKGLSILITQGQAGAVELKELASLLSSVAPQMKRFGVEGPDALAELGGALQVVRKGFGSGAEAVTGMQAMMNKLAANATKFEKAGVRIFDKDPETGAKRLRRISNLVADISESSLMRDPTRLQKAFGSSEAVRAFEQLSQAPELWHKLYEEGMASNAVQRDFLTYQASSAAKMERAWAKIKNAIAREVTPERIEAIAAMFSKVADAVGWAADNIELLISILLSAKLAQGALALTGLANAGGALGGAAGGVNKFGRALGGLGGVAAAGALGYGLGTLLNDALKLSGVDYTAPKSSRFDRKGYADGARIEAQQLRTGVMKQLGIGPSDQRFGKELSEADVRAIAEERRSRVQMGPRGVERGSFDAQLERDLMFDIRTAKSIEMDAVAVETMNRLAERVSGDQQVQQARAARNRFAELFPAFATEAFFHRFELAMERAMAKGKTEIKVDYKVVAEATRNDPNVRRRPGG